MRQIFFFLLLFVSIALHAQTIVGHVVDEATGENIGFASVFARKTTAIKTQNATPFRAAFSVYYHSNIIQTLF